MAQNKRARADDDASTDAGSPPALAKHSSSLSNTTEHDFTHFSTSANPFFVTGEMFKRMISAGERRAAAGFCYPKDRLFAGCGFGVDRSTLRLDPARARLVFNTDASYPNQVSRQRRELYCHYDLLRNMHVFADPEAGRMLLVNVFVVAWKGYEGCELDRFVDIFFTHCKYDKSVLESLKITPTWFTCGPKLQERNDITQRGNCDVAMYLSVHGPDVYDHFGKEHCQKAAKAAKAAKADDGGSEL